MRETSRGNFEKRGTVFSCWNRTKEIKKVVRTGPSFFPLFRRKPHPISEQEPCHVERGGFDESGFVREGFDVSRLKEHIGFGRELESSDDEGPMCSRERVPVVDPDSRQLHSFPTLHHLLRETFSLPPIFLLPGRDMHVLRQLEERILEHRTRRRHLQP